MTSTHSRPPPPQYSSGSADVRCPVCQDDLLALPHVLLSPCHHGIHDACLATAVQHGYGLQHTCYFCSTRAQGIHRPLVQPPATVVRFLSYFLYELLIHI